jgi:hypothetical protein
VIAEGLIDAYSDVPYHCIEIVMALNVLRVN